MCQLVAIFSISEANRAAWSLDKKLETLLPREMYKIKKTRLDPEHGHSMREA